MPVKRKVVGEDIYLAGYTAGDFGGTNAGGYDIFVMKLDAAGAQQWTEQLGGSKDDYARRIEVKWAAFGVVWCWGLQELSVQTNQDH